MSSLRIRYQTIEFDEVDIHVRTLRDRQQYLDVDDSAKKLNISEASWPLFGVVWPASMVLARFLFKYEVTGKRILEVGCGIGLSSLLLNHLQADITATDHHPEAERFLKENIKLNEGPDIPFVRTGWADNDSSLGRFDLIIGSDLLYEQDHVDLLSRFIGKHARPLSEVIIVDPGRGLHPRFSKKMFGLGYTLCKSKPEVQDGDIPTFRGVLLHYNRQQ